MVESGLQELLERLQTALRCAYLSDLRGEHGRLLLPRAVRQIPTQDYPLEVWQAAVSYITCDDSRVFHSADEAREFLMASHR